MKKEKGVVSIYKSLEDITVHREDGKKVGIKKGARVQFFVMEYFKKTDKSFALLVVENEEDSKKLYAVNLESQFFNNFFKKVK